MSDPIASFHPVIQAWFKARFAAPTDAQAGAWPAIKAGGDTLIAAPTGSGKTLAAFLAGIDALWRQAERGELADGLQILYVSPLKALGNDIHRNLEQPLAELRALAADLGHPAADIRTLVRSGDTTQAARRDIVLHPPHILITTPESLYLMLTAERTRELLRGVKTVIVDEIHALIRDKRGSHLALSLARLDHVCEKRPQRIGLSATQRPIETTARFLVGAGQPLCDIIDLGHQRDIDLAIEVPPSDLGAVGTHEQWAEIYDRLATLIQEHRTTLIFVNTRRLAERVAHHLSERLGKDQVSSHHGSLAKEKRLALEERLKAGELRALVATASLELGIDIGTIDLVCQIASPRSISTFLQRVGRSGHALGLVPRGRLFPTSRDELVECSALVRAIHAGRLDRIEPPMAPLDILAQQIVAESACEPWQEDELLALVRKAAPYEQLETRDYEDVLEMLAEGLGPSRRGRYLHRDRLSGSVKGRRNARLTALQCGGAIPDLADYRVVAEPDETVVGTLNEDFAIESMAGDIFLLGSTSWRIRRVEAGTVRVEDARGAPPTIPFWLGEAPARTLELSQEVDSLRRDLSSRLDDLPGAEAWLTRECGLEESGAAQLAAYVRAGRDGLGVLPTAEDIVFERFFDDAGGMQLVIHSPLGGRINRAWGLAMRKRFCVNFNFELQAAANDDAIVISLGEQHSFPLEDAFRFLTPGSVEPTLTQALLTAPVFGSRWRWNASRALAIIRQRGGKRVPTPIQRMNADDLMAAVFPDLAACQENVSGPIELPDHPLVKQTVSDCLHEAMDIDGLRALLTRIETGQVRLHARDTTEPSPFSHEILNAKPYTFLDDAPLEERRTRALSVRRTLPESARDLGVLDEAAIDLVRQESAPDPRDPDELHDVLLSVIAMPACSDWRDRFDQLAAAGRAAEARTPEGDRFWFAAEHLPFATALYPSAELAPSISLPPHLQRSAIAREEAVLETLRGHMDYFGPAAVEGLARMLAFAPGEVASALARLEGEGLILRGHFTPGRNEEEWCNRRLLARIHRHTLDRLRAEIEPVSPQDLMRFLLRWQHLAADSHLAGRHGLREVIRQLQGFEIAVSAWEKHVLPTRLPDYRPSWLDELCFSGETTWGRFALRQAADNGRRTTPPSGAAPISLALRGDLSWLLPAVRNGHQPTAPTVGAGAEVWEVLQQRGALFYDDIMGSVSGRMPDEIERGLWELVSRGLVTADGFQALRALMARRNRRAHAMRRRAPFLSRRLTADPAGRWSVLSGAIGSPLDSDELAETWAQQLLARYGIVFRDLVMRESFAVPWRDVIRAFRRLEARGLVRGGRFVSGFLGEQYALPEAVEGLRRIRRQQPDGELLRVNATDPLNLVGIITPGPRVPSAATNAIIYRDGTPVVSEEGRRTVMRAYEGEAALQEMRARRERQRVAAV